MELSQIKTVTLEATIPTASFVQHCVDVSKFHQCCRQCPNFSNTWSCPPFDFFPESVWQSYQTLLLYGKKVMIPVRLQEKSFSADELESVSVSLLQPVKDRIFSHLLQLERQTIDSMALSAGSCRLCGEGNCTRSQSLLCSNPSRMRYSIESLGGDVGLAVALYLGEQMIWGRSGHLPSYYMLIDGLLMDPVAAVPRRKG
jgi:predicted metal-binding protein